MTAQQRGSQKVISSKGDILWLQATQFNGAETTPQK